MLTYEKDVKPIKITAREAYKRSIGTEEDYIKLLIDIYDLINEEVNNRNTSIDYWIDSLYLADRVFNELVTQGYNINLEKDMVADKVWHLSIDWEDVDLDPNKKYILPMEGTEAEDCLGNMAYSYAAKQEGGSWYIGHKSPFADPKIHFTVTAKDIEEAPEWVKAIEPVEVND